MISRLIKTIVISFIVDKITRFILDRPKTTRARR